MNKHYINYLFTSIISAVLGFIIVIYLSQYLLPEEYGLLGVFLMMLYFVQPMISFVSTGLLEINIINLNIQDYKLFRHKFINFGFFNFIILLLLAFIFSFFFEKYRLLILFLPFLSITRFLIQIKTIELIQRRKSKEYSYFIILLSVLMFLCTVFFISYLDFSWEGRVMAMILSEFILVVFVFRKKINLPIELKIFNKSERKEVINFGFPFVIALFAAWIMQESDRLIVLNFLSLSDVGLYTFAYLIGKSIDVLNTSFIKTIKPVFYQRMKEKKLSRKHFSFVLFYFSLGIILITTILTFVIDNFGSLLIADEYISAVNIIYIVLYAFSVYGMYRVSSIVLEYYKKNSLKTKTFYLGAIINVVSSIALIDVFGILSPALGTMLGFFILLIITYFQSIKLLVIYQKNKDV